VAPQPEQGGLASGDSQQGEAIAQPRAVGAVMGVEPVDPLNTGSAGPVAGLLASWLLADGFGTGPALPLEIQTHCGQMGPRADSEGCSGEQGTEVGRFPGLGKQVAYTRPAQTMSAAPVPQGRNFARALAACRTIRTGGGVDPSPSG